MRMYRSLVVVSAALGLFAACADNSSFTVSKEEASDSKKDFSNLAGPDAPEVAARRIAAVTCVDQLEDSEIEEVAALPVLKLPRTQQDADGIRGVIAGLSDDQLTELTDDLKLFCPNVPDLTGPDAPEVAARRIAAVTCVDQLEDSEIEEVAALPVLKLPRTQQDADGIRSVIAGLSDDQLTELTDDLKLFCPNMPD